MLVRAGGCPGPVTRLAQGSSGSTDHPVELKLIQPFAARADDAGCFLFEVAGCCRYTKWLEVCSKSDCKKKNWLAELAEESPNV